MNYNETQLFEMIANKIDNSYTIVYEVDNKLFKGQFCRRQNGIEQKYVTKDNTFSNVCNTEPDEPGSVPDITYFFKNACKKNECSKVNKNKNNLLCEYFFKLKVEETIKNILAKINKRDDKDEINLGLDDLNLVENIKFLDSNVELPFYILPNDAEIKVVSIVKHITND